MTKAGRTQLRGVVDGLGLARPGRTVAVIVAHPELWSTAVRLGLRSAAVGWWRRWPASPAPPADFIAFRRQTMLGSTGSAGLQPAEVLGYLRWVRRMRALGG